MKKPSQNSKSFWQDDIVLKTTSRRKRIEYLVEKKTMQHGKLSSRFVRLLKKIF